MLEKRPRSGSSVEVTFRMPPLEGVVELYLCGDFNNWHMSGMPLKQEPDGSWVTRIILESGKSYRFRYCDNQGRWHNDWDADAYVPNAFGSEDSVIDLAAPARNVGASSPAATGRGRGGPGQTRRGSGTRSESRPGSESRRGGRHFGPSSGGAGGGSRPGGRNQRPGGNSGKSNGGRGQKPR